jgi:flagellar biosynthesis component FlhA
MSPLLDAGITLSTEVNLWSILLPVVITALTAGAITLGTKFLDRNKNSAEEKKLSAEEKKLLAEADKAKTEKDSLENEEWRKLYAETKSQHADLKKQYEDLKIQSDEQIQKLKKESDEQMGFLKKQISIHSDTLELQGANFETQEQTIQELKDEVQAEKTARLKLEAIVKKFQQWAIRNRAELESAKIEPIPVFADY